MKHLVLSLLMCLAVGSGDSHAAEPVRIELRPLKSVTVTEEQFLRGAKDGPPVTLAVELRVPTAGTARLPAMILLHGSAGVQAGGSDRWARELNDLGIATLIVDSFTERGITSTIDAQDQLSEVAVVIDAYRALEMLAKHPRIDPARIGLLGASRGAVSTLYASMKRFQRMYAPADAQFAVYLSLYPPCYKAYIGETDVADRPIRLFNGTADEIAPIRQCLAYVKRLRDAGKDAQLTEYPGAFHGFDNPDGAGPARVKLGGSDAPRRGCDLYEQPGGRIMNRETSLPFTRDDDCLKGVGTVLYDARAHAKLIEDVRAVVQRVFKLSPK
jgi:dienelactone hydrolase